MRKLRMLWARVKGQRAQKRAGEDFDEEIRGHIALLEERYTAQGMSASEAAHAARLQFGNVTVLRERHRAQRGLLAPGEWMRDVRFGMRMLAKRPISSAAVVLALALGIGMNAAVFTFVNALLLRPPQAVRSPETLLDVWLHKPKSTGVDSYLPFSYPAYADFRDHTRSLEGLLAFGGDGQQAIWNHAGTGQVLHGEVVSGNFFPLLGVQAVAGRLLTADDDTLGNPRQTVVLSDAFWKQNLGGDPDVVGRTLLLDGARFTVVGVAPPDFTGIMVGVTPDFYAPLAAQAFFSHDPALMTQRDTYWLIVAGRMRNAGDRKSVQAEMRVLAQQDWVTGGRKDDPLAALVYPLALVPGPFRGYVGAFTGGLLLVFALVLLIACTNAASLLLARATGRAREMATRAALGAGRARLVRQMLVESLLLAGIAGTAGVAIAWATSRLLLQLKPAELPITLDIPLDWRVVAFTAAVSIATAVIFGLAPALRASAVQAARVLKDESPAGGRKRSRMRSVLVVAQMATCVVLLAGAALCVRSLRNANAIDAGFDTHHIALATLDPGSLGYSEAQVNDFYARLLERVRRLPGVTSASYAEFLPLGTSHSVASASLCLGNDPNASRVHVYRVGSDFFRTMGIPLLRGRDLTSQEAQSDKPDAVVVNEYLARRMWPGENPVGKRLALGGEKTMSEVVGVAANGKYQSLGEGPVDVVFRGQMPAQRTLVVRTRGNSRALLNGIRREVPLVDPLMAATQVQTIEQYMAFPLFPARTTGWLLGVSGLLAVVMTTIGLFGVIACVVSQRTHEIGVRMALGACRSDVLKMVMNQGLRLTAIGLGIGLCAALGATRLLAPLLYGIGANDPATMTAVVVGLAVIALVACCLPARKAMSVEPSVALRYE